MLLVANLGKYEIMQNIWKMTETLNLLLWDDNSLSIGRVEKRFPRNGLFFSAAGNEKVKSDGF